MTFLRFCVVQQVACWTKNADGKLPVSVIGARNLQRNMELDWQGYECFRLRDCLRSQLEVAQDCEHPCTPVYVPGICIKDMH